MSIGCMLMCCTWTVSLRDLAPCPSVPMDATKYSQADTTETVEANAPILTPDALQILNRAHQLQCAKLHVLLVKSNQHLAMVGDLYLLG